MQRYLILTGDDLGAAPDIDRATLTAVDCGGLSGVEIMPTGPSFMAAAEAMRARPEIDLGVHLTLISEFRTWRWGPVLPPERVPSLCRPDGTLHASLDALREHAEERDAIAELEAQLARVEDAGLRPSHVSQHMFTLDVWGSPTMFEWLARACRARGLSARVTNERGAAMLRDAGVTVIDRVIGDTHDVPAPDKRSAYERAIHGIGPGVTEMLLHCGHDGGALRSITASAERRQRDFELACSGELRPAIASSGVQLVSYRTLRDVTDCASSRG